MTRSEWVADALRAAVIAAIGVVLLILVPEATSVWGYSEVPPTAPPFWPSTVVLAVACAGVVLRRVRPGLCLLVVLAAIGLGVVWQLEGTHIGVALAGGEALYSVALYGSRRLSVGVTAAVTGWIAVSALLNLVSVGAQLAVVSLISQSLLLIPVVWGREVREHRNDAQAQRERAERERAAAVGAERARMARDLHDVVAGQLSAIAIQTEAALTLRDPDPETLRRLLEAVRGGSVAALAEMRTMIGLLRADGADGDPVTAPAGLDRLDTLVEAGRTSGLLIDVDDRRPPDPPPPAAVDLAAFRIVQESLTNAAKHAPGSTVTLRLAGADDRLTVELTNPVPRRTAAAGGTGTGLIGLRERAAAVGGTLRAGPDGGAGGSTWTVRADLPWSRQPSEPAAER